MREKINVEAKTNELHEQIERIECLGEIYNKLIDQMRWDCMKYHAADEEHEESWFTDYDEEEDSYYYEKSIPRKTAYEEVLTAIEKMMK